MNENELVTSQSPHGGCQPDARDLRPKSIGCFYDIPAPHKVKYKLQIGTRLGFCSPTLYWQDQGAGVKFNGST